MKTASDGLNEAKYGDRKSEHTRELSTEKGEFTVDIPTPVLRPQRRAIVEDYETTSDNDLRIYESIQRMQTETGRISPMKKTLYPAKREKSTEDRKIEI